MVFRIAIIAGIFFAATAALSVACLGASLPPGISGYGAMKRDLVQDCTARPFRLHLYDIGLAGSGKRSLWMVRVEADPAAHTLVDAPRLLVICRQHGDEPVSTQAALTMLHKFAFEPRSALRADLGRAVVYIIPMANPDGAEVLSRLNANGADLNRDWGKFTQPETRDIVKAFDAIRPQAVLDLHSWDLTDPFQHSSIEAGERDANVAENMTLALQSRMIHDENASGEPMDAVFYPPSIDQSLAHRYFADRGAASLLVETSSCRPVATQIDARIGIDFTAIDCVLAQMNRHPRQWLRVARWQRSQPAPPTAFVASADALIGIPTRHVGMNRASQVAQNLNTAVAFAPRDRQSVEWALALYALGCVVLARFGGKISLRALRRLGFVSGRSSGTGPARYISPRRRVFPVQPAGKITALREPARPVHHRSAVSSRNDRDPWESLRDPAGRSV